MSLDLLYGADIDANYRRQVFTPRPAPETSFSLFSMAGAGFAGFPGAALEVTGSAIDLLGPADRAVRSRPRPAVLQDQPAARQGEQVTGDVFRAKAAEFAPDPQTAHVADQVMYGLTRFGAKAAAAMLVGGPAAGAAMLAAEETNTAARGLMEKGVDTDTAILTGMSIGAINALGVALPVSGAALPLTMTGKAAATAGLVVAGGPGSFVAQEVLAREILQGTGYDIEAATHDQTNPLGLALSVLLPGLFGAVAMRGAVKQAKAMTAREEAQAAADAAMLDPARLTVLRDEIANPLTSDKERARLLAQVAKIDAAAKQAPEAVDAARVVLTERALTANLPDRPDARSEVLRAMDEIAAGRVPDVMPFDAEAAASVRLFDSQITQLEGELAATLPDAGGLAERGAIRQAREELRLMEQTRPDASEAATRDLAKEIQARERVSYKTALAEAKKLIGDQVATWEARSTRLQSFIADNAEAQKQTQRAVELQRQIDDLRQQREEAASKVGPEPPPRAEAESPLPRDDAPPEAAPAAAEPAAPPPNAIPRDLKAETVALRKAENLLSKLLECVT